MKESLKRKGKTSDVCLPGSQAIIKRILMAARNQGSQLVVFWSLGAGRMGNLKYFWLQQSVLWDAGCCTDDAICANGSSLVKVPCTGILGYTLCGGTDLGRGSQRELGFISFILSFPAKSKSCRTPPQFYCLHFLSTNRNLVWCLSIYFLYYRNNIPTLVFSACYFHSFLCCCNLSML